MSEELTKSDREKIDELVEALEKEGATLDDIQMEPSNPLYGLTPDRAVEFAFRGRVVYRPEESKDE